MAEDSARSLNDDTVIARGFALLGPRLPPQFAAAEFVNQALDPRYLTVAGTGATMRSYIYAADAAAYLWHLLAFGTSGEAYNVGSDSPCTIGTLACHVAHAAGLDVDTAIRWGKPSRDAAPFVPSTAKLRHLLGDDWAPPLTPLESIERWIKWERT
jgi:dTDP-glucose 4,6-dehydratase